MKNKGLWKWLFVAMFSFHPSLFIAQPVINTTNALRNGKLNISSFVDYTSDTTERAIAVIDQRAASLWQSNRSNKSFRMGISNKLYWFSIRLQNTGINTTPYYLLINNKGINKLELFSKKGNALSSLGRTGDHYPFTQRPYVSSHFIFPVSIPAGDTSHFYLFCDKKNENLNFSIELYTAEQLRLRENKTQLFIGIFLGILFLGFLISGLLYYVFKDKLPIWYSIYILAVANWLLTFEGMDFQYLYPYFPFYANITRYIASSVILALLMYIMQLYCYQQASNSRFYHTTNVFRWMVILFIPATFIIYRYFPFYYVKKIHFVLFVIEQCGGILLLVISCIEKIIQRFKPAVFYLLAVSMLLVAGNLAILQEIGVVKMSSETPHLIQWSFVMEMILIIVGILYRYNLIKQENDQLYNELNEQKINSIKQILATQQQEQQRIAEDLHDILGGQLAAIKMKIGVLDGITKNTQGIANLIDEVVVNTRNIAHNLLPVQLHNNAISDIIATYLLQLNNNQSITFRFIQTGIPINFTKEVEVDVYKILMEIIQNILKHSRATEATIQFFFTETALEINAEDNGQGIPASAPKGMGINNILKRVQKLNGTTHIDTAAGYTNFIINIPVKK